MLRRRLPASRRPNDAEATTALAILASALDGAAVAHVLEAGELLIADNRRVVHGRTSFAPRYDGTDRWLGYCARWSAPPSARTVAAALRVP